jgi:4-hydroxy-tetrahydrodipicolinate reductase
MTRLIIAGAKGRMGQALLRCAEAMPGLAIAGQFDLGQDLRDFIAGGDVVIDFTFHESTVPLARICAKHKKPMVIGATGHTDAEQKELLQLSAQIPLVWSSNFSTGVNALFWLTRKAAELLGPEFDVEIIEMHHRLKKDAPSGTAKTLARIVAEARRQQLAGLLRHGREGLVGERSHAEIGLHSLRGGDVVGDHTVVFAAAGERLELTHKASSRETFAGGALRAAKWVAGKKPGLYDMQDVLGLR